MILHWRGLDFEITGFNYHLDQTPSVETIPPQHQTLKHVEFINVSNKPTQDTSLERF